MARELEARKLHTALLEEQLRQLNLEEDSRYAGVRKQAEAAAAETALTRERVAQAALQRELTAAKTPPPAARPDVRVQAGSCTAQPPKEDKKPQPAPVAAPVAPVVQEARFQLLSVLKGSSGATALVEIGQNVVSVSDGQSTPYGQVRIGDGEVLLGTRRLVVSDTVISRVWRPEAEKPAMPVTPGVAPIPLNSGARSVVQPQAAQPATPPVGLPPLVLPPNLPSAGGAGTGLR